MPAALSTWVLVITGTLAAAGFAYAGVRRRFLPIVGIACVFLFAAVLAWTATAFEGSWVLPLSYLLSFTAAVSSFVATFRAESRRRTDGR